MHSRLMSAAVMTAVCSVGVVAQAHSQVSQAAGAAANHSASLQRLSDTHVAMMSLPPMLRAMQSRTTATTPGDTSSQAVATPAGKGAVHGAAGGAALAPRETVRDRVTFENLDRDNDGYISMVEAAIDAHSVELFKALDSDHDYRVSRDEWLFGVDRGVVGADEAQTPR